MSIHIVELKPDKVTIDEFKFPNKEQDFYIYDHLRYYCSKLTTLPAISIKIIDNVIFASSRSQYLTIAKELNRNRIQAVINLSSSKEDITKILNKPYVVQLDWEAVKKKERETLINYAWYIFFFQKTLNQDEKKAFEKDVVNFFRLIKLPSWATVPDQRIKDLAYSYSGLCCEFQAYVPIADERWYSSARAKTEIFHLNCVPIVSFQGRKFKVD